MATATGYTAARMKEIEDTTVVNGSVDAGGYLILETREGTQIDAGYVKGADGADATPMLGVTDSTSLDLSLTGAGTAPSPWDLTATVKDLYAQALLDATYTGPGPAKVTFPGQALSTDKYQWLSKYEPWGNRCVTMVRQGSTWGIVGHSAVEGFGGKIYLESGTNWTSWNRRNYSNNYSDLWRAQRLSSGIVVLSGMGLSISAATSGQLIARLPPGYRPDTDLLVQVIQTNQAKIMRIKADGDILVYGTGWVTSSNDWLSLDGIAFPAAGVATWTNIGSGGSSYQNGTAAFDVANFGTPGFWKDPYGIVWFRGLIRSGTTTSDAAMINMPSGHGNYLQSHVIVGAGTGSAGGEGLGFVSVFTDAANGKITWKSGNVGGTSGWISLARLTIVTADAMSILRWTTFTLSPTWGNYPGSFPPAQFVRRPDGLAMSQGLLVPGSMNVAVGNLSDYLSPDNAIILAAVGADVVRRWDIFGFRVKGVPTSELQASITVGAWQSLDGQKWMVGD